MGNFVQQRAGIWILKNLKFLTTGCIGEFLNSHFLIFQSAVHGFCDFKLENAEIAALFLKISRTKIFLLYVWFWCGSSPERQWFSWTALFFVYFYRQKANAFSFGALYYFPCVSLYVFNAYLQHRQVTPLYVLSRSLSSRLVPFPCCSC